MKNQKANIVISQIVLSTFFSCQVLAQAVHPEHLKTFTGNSNGGGGQAVVCRDSSRKILSAKMLDLFEAEKVYKLKPLPVDGSKTYQELAYEVGDRITVGGLGYDVTEDDTNHKPLFFGILPVFHKLQLQAAILQAINGMNLIPDSILNPIDDSNPIVRPAGCEIEQVARYYDNSLEVHVAEEIWNAFDKISKAALLVHEGFYDIQRRNGETNSDRTRRVVGHGFAGSQFKYVLDGIMKDGDAFNETIICGTIHETDPKYRFAVYKNEWGFWNLQFLWLHGALVLSKTIHTATDDVSPVTPLPTGSSMRSTTTRISESLFDDKKFISLKKEKDTSGKILNFVGLVTDGFYGPKMTYEVTCNRTQFRCTTSYCEYKTSPL